MYIYNIYIHTYNIYVYYDICVCKPKETKLG